MLHTSLRALLCVMAIILGAVTGQEAARADFVIEENFPDFAKQIAMKPVLQVKKDSVAKKRSYRRVASVGNVQALYRPARRAEQGARPRLNKTRSSNRTVSRRASKKTATSSRRVRVASLSKQGYRVPAAKRAKASSSRYSALIAKHASANGIPIALAHAVVRIESGYRAHVRGGAGEVGLMQIKPSTARAIGYRGSTRGLYNPDTNLRWGMKYLGGAYRRAGGKVCGTVLRYNAGHYARRMNPISARYCRKARRIMGRRRRT